jgi:hypothetical protein
MGEGGMHSMSGQESEGTTIMKITIKHLGAIQHAELDLKPLTILIGPNNAGKTWMAYTLGGIFGYRGWREYVRAYVDKKVPEIYPPLDEAIRKVQEKGSATIDLVDFAERYGESYFQYVADYAQTWMSEYMSTQYADFGNMQISVDLTGSKAAFLERVKQSSIHLSVAGQSFKMIKRPGEPKLRAYTSAENDEPVSEKIPPEEIRSRMIHRVTVILHQALYSETCVFPTERTTFITFHFGRPSSSMRSQSSLLSEQNREACETILKALQQLRESAGTDFNEMQPQELGNVIGPVGYFLDMWSDILLIGSKEMGKRERDAKKPLIQKYRQLADLLEQDLLAGKLGPSTQEPDPRREILFHPLQEVVLEMPISSSMVKELAPLVLYLRYLAWPDELLIIDEPEMNLHPEAQAKMIEFLCMLVNAGLRVLVTTHSTYIVDHLANLIHAAQRTPEEQKSLAENFFLESCDTFISQENVSVYCVENGTAENILREDGVIDWHTFGDISDQISRIHFSL